MSRLPSPHPGLSPAARRRSAPRAGESPDGHARPAAGALDRTFADGGQLLVDLPGGPYTLVRSLAVHEDGTAVVALRPQDRPRAGVVLARFRADGSPDPAFGRGGLVRDDLGGGNPHTVAVQADGKVVVAGWLDRLPGGGLVLARFLADGRPDQTFQGGLVVEGFGRAGVEISRIAMQDDGTIVAAGAVAAGDTSALFVARFRSDGRRDPAFGAGGQVLTRLGGWAAANDVAVDAGGSVVVGGAIDDDLTVARYRPDGRLDGRFGAGGVATLGLLGPARQVQVQAGGAVLALGPWWDGERTRYAVARYDARGVPDATCAGDGLLRLAAPLAGVRGLAVQPDGKILVAGVDAAGALVLARFTVAGLPDETFAVGGRVRTGLGGRASLLGLAVQGDGKVVLAAQRETNAGRSLLGLVRYLGDSRPTVSGPSPGPWSRTTSRSPC